MTTMEPPGLKKSLAIQVDKTFGSGNTLSGQVAVPEPPKRAPLDMAPDDVRALMAFSAHLGSTNINHQMNQYVYKRRDDGVHIISIKKTWEKLLLAARAIAAALENKEEVVAISSKPYSQRAVLKFAAYTGAIPLAGRYTPGTFTNQIQKAFREPALLILSDPRVDHQPITESSYVNIPVIAFCNTDSPLRFVDIAIPCNNKGNNSVGLMWWLLTREVQRMRGNIGRDAPWDVMVDLFIYKEPEPAITEDERAELTNIPEKVPVKGDETWAGEDTFDQDAGKYSGVQMEFHPSVATPAEVVVNGNVGGQVTEWSEEPTRAGEIQLKAPHVGDWGGPEPSTWD